MVQRRRSAAGFIHLILFLLFCLVLGGIGGLVISAIRGAPSFEDIAFDPEQATIIYDINKEVITKFYVENRTPVPLEKISPVMRQAIVAIEDARFYEHHGVDARAIMRALVTDLRHRSTVEGGSTITQQLAKNAFLTHEKTFARKFAEALWAIQIERKYTKDEILEKYLNEIYFGHGAYGIEAAAQLYFGKHAEALTLPEAALLAGIPRSPLAYSPYNNLENAKARRNLVLSRMAQLGYITPAERDKAQAAPIKLAGLRVKKTQKAPYFSEYVLQYLLQRYDQQEVFAGGLKVYTTLDLKMQAAAEKALLEGLPDGPVDGNGLKQPQGALIAIDPRTGYIKAMVGGRGTDKFNRAVQAHRQPGSAIKPFIYTAAIANGYSPDTKIVDEPVRYVLADGKNWAPTNYDHKYRGSITLRRALEESVNVVAVKLLDEIGVDTAIDYAKRMGLTDLVETGWNNDRNLSLALGGLTRGVTPLELASAYGVLANGGVRAEPLAVLRVEDRHGYTLEENQPRRETVLSEEVCFTVTDMLRGVIQKPWGTGRAANIGRPAAGKTGTTNDHTNVWFVGYTPDLVAAVWIGNDVQKKPLIFHGRLVSSSVPARIWGNFLRQALAGEPVRTFPIPVRLQERVKICTESDALAGPNCPADKVRERVFLRGTAPREVCPLHNNPAGTSPELSPGQGDGQLAPGEGEMTLPGPDGEMTPPPENNDTGTGKEINSGEGLPTTSVAAPWRNPTAEGRKPVRLPICSESGALATRWCPPDLVEYHWYDRRSGAELDAQGNPIPGRRLPRDYCPLHR